MKDVEEFITALVTIEEQESCNGDYGHHPMQLHVEDQEGDMSLVALCGQPVASVYRIVKEYKDNGINKLYLSLDFPNVYKDWVIDCTDCCARVFDYTKEKAIKLWNNRHNPKHETVDEWETINHELAYPKDNELCLYESELGAKFLGYLKNGIWYKISDQNPIDKHFNIVRFMRYPESNHHGKPEIEG